MELSPPTAPQEATDGGSSSLGNLAGIGALPKPLFRVVTDAKGVIQIFNVGAERMPGYAAADVMNKITPVLL